ncbi:DUF3347 domain-containing protein [Roseivirga spongicola]|jgi:PBP1b-binding outer membrane lipoprotein LpoB|uniref:DUF3347 domain-containing protein n=1 Tax=Roseivirga spongicola TaxID=333140 RepID=A0A150XA34_9BACT|nr:DUF3347 domain-containing protein [Roseivirga spongicola]KYG75595.1 hypothetical protein AWW68_07095 [Roseivirga spongicola]PWL24797.1 MAG: DUF3347 domain-containing protein [Roseivirga sp. XM-24bin3]WPZ10845.1 DUF3347 domain-containing protein [Roseivirga spongicola]
MKKLIALLGLTLILTSCGSGAKETKQETATESANPVESYLAIKDALVKTDAAEASKAAKAFLKSNSNQKLDSSLETIANTSDVKIQRQAFETLSMEMYEVVKANNNETPLYKQYCPMAFNNQGAYWLAAEEEVNNPYFGDLMLHCGSVEEVIQ